MKFLEEKKKNLFLESNTQKVKNHEINFSNIFNY